jgi:hypothetical protein
MADGLKKLRNTTDKAPKYECSNCKCKRYNPCRCMKKAGTVVEPEENQTSE